MKIKLSIAKTVSKVISTSTKLNQIKRLQYLVGKLIVDKSIVEIDELDKGQFSTITSSISCYVISEKELQEIQSLFNLLSKDLETHQLTIVEKILKNIRND